MARDLHHLRPGGHAAAAGGADILSRLRVAGTIVIAFLVLALLPTPTVQGSDAPVDLAMGDHGSLPWSISSLQPGDRGTEAVEVRNGGTSPAYLRIWISGVQATDQGNDGAALIEYMRFGLAAEGLRTTMELPAAIDRFPASPSDRGQLVIGPIGAGAAATMYWTWEFVETGAPQNDAQGDGLSFDISYMLTDAPPPAVSYRYVTIDMLGWQTAMETDSTGVVQHAVDAVDPLGIHHLRVAAGTRIIDVEGNVPSRLVLSVIEGPDIDGPAGTVKLGPTYMLQGRLADGAPTEVMFSTPATVVLGVNAASVPAGYLPMGVHRLADGAWSRLPAASWNLSRWSAEGSVNGTGTLAVFAAPADDDTSPLSARNLDIQLTVQKNGWPIALSTTRGRSVTVTATVTNLGNTSGIYSVELLVDGAARSTVVVVLEAGEGRTVTFTVADMEDGDHELTLLDRTAKFRSGTSVEWLPILVPNALAISLLAYVRRRPPRGRRSGGRGALRGSPQEVQEAPGPSALENGVPMGELASNADIANPQLLGSISDKLEGRREHPSDIANPQLMGSISEALEGRIGSAPDGNPQLMRSLGSVWEWRRAPPNGGNGMA
ncbi:MAG: hypothetical protein ISF22_10225 [Methanomassiliicoccus sp.]|nr:hypothetical protein [Methanomassiliicoccus sp.]